MVSFVDDDTMTKVAEALGEEGAVQILDILRNASEITDDEIANKTEIRLNLVRKILYKLYDRSLVGLRRSRDKETGWFIFHWRLQPGQFEGFITNQKRHILEKLESRLQYEKDHDFYYCNTPGCRRVPFEEAMEIVFRCPTCNKPLKHYENGKIIHVLTEKIAKLREELGE
ncbi:transcription factor [Candidatus Bathyarchaeota archaeon]|nr:transcription factor [Candidatus Bathyarchaeota archaeon]NIU81017.1 transcription factor [Candidatus Bathyarchaeota archaeon]NIV67673.1 transcription factor [Candidatus Bathyarchaeota archaeon]NIW16243.1 transcription factor [Candidatus Bathyarchaeota archaeon]NIW34281.1 transcription factor [Candidatus Bathyarchaeota archaeon]